LPEVVTKLIFHRHFRSVEERHWDRGCHLPTFEYKISLITPVRAPVKPHKINQNQNPHEIDSVNSIYIYISGTITFSHLIVKTMKPRYQSFTRIGRQSQSHPRSQGLSAARVLPRPWDTPNRNCKKTCTNF
jgi:hypothetical protein